MKGRAKGVFCVIFGLFLLMIGIGGNSQDKAFYEEAKTTTGTVRLISEETKTVRRRKSSGDIEQEGLRNIMQGYPTILKRMAK